ncbi:hypothetical protein FRC04_002985 [Tulasnella sp. 424]|nr:hypothetical protein FRC04_002985 [Tulasnella sp. 424]
MNDSVIMHFDPLRSPERKALSNPSLPPDKENMDPDQLSMSVYFNRPYGMFSNPASPEKKPSSPRKKGALIELSFVSENGSDEEEEMEFGMDGEDDTIKLGPILAGLDVSKTPDLRRIPFGDAGQADVGFNMPVMRFKSMLPETSGKPTTPLRTSQRLISISPVVTTLPTPLTAIRVAPNPFFPPQTPSTVRPLRVITSDGTSGMVPKPEGSRPAWSVHEYPPLPPSPIDEGTSLTLEPPLEGSENDDQGNYDGEPPNEERALLTQNEELVGTSLLQPKMETQPAVNASDRPDHLSPPVEPSGRNRLSLDLDATFDLRNVRFQDVSFDLLKGEMSFLGRNAEGDNVIYATNTNELDEPPSQLEDDIPPKLSVRTDLRQSCAETIKSPREIQLPESRPSSVASTIPTDEEAHPLRPRSVLQSTRSLGTKAASSSTVKLTSARPGASEQPSSNLGLARRPTTRTEASGKLRPIRSIDIAEASSSGTGTSQEPVRPRSKLLTAILRPPSRTTDVDEAPVDRPPARTIKHGRASSVGTLRSAPSLASLSSKVGTQTSRLTIPENGPSQPVPSTKSELQRPQPTSTLASRPRPRPSSVSTLPSTLSRPATSLGVSRAAPTSVAPAAGASRPRPSIVSSRPSIATSTSKPRASTVMATPRPTQSHAVSTASKLPAARPASRIGIPLTRPVPSTRRAI